MAARVASAGHGLSLPVQTVPDVRVCALRSSASSAGAAGSQPATDAFPLLLLQLVTLFMLSRVLTGTLSCGIGTRHKSSYSSTYRYQGMCLQVVNEGPAMILYLGTTDADEAKSRAHELIGALATSAKAAAAAGGQDDIAFLTASCTGGAVTASWGACWSLPRLRRAQSLETG